MSHLIKLSSSNIENQKDLEFSNLFNKDNVRNFENKIQKVLTTKKDVLVLNSGTSSIHIALLLSGVRNGDEVLCQNFTYVASANPIAYIGAKPVFIDSEIDTWNMCPKYLELAIKDRISHGVKPKAILVVHSYGMPAKMDIISKLARKYQITLIEDAAEALGSKYKNQKCGTFGDYGILSFNDNKIITALGGGALICNSKELKEKAVYLSTQAKGNFPHYEHNAIGYNYRMSSVIAKIGVEQIKNLNLYVKLRRSNNKFYQKLFSPIKGITVLREISSNFFSNHWLTCVTIEPEECGFTREQLRLHLMEDKIESRPLWKPLNLQPVFEESLFFGENISHQLFDKGLCLPSGSNLSKKDKNRIAKSLEKFLNNINK